MITKKFLFKFADGSFIIINTLILMFVFNWSNIVYPFLIALVIYILPKVIVKALMQAGFRDEREELIDKKASFDTILFIKSVALGSILIASVYYYINQDDVSKLIIIISAIVVQSLIWFKSFILEYDYEVNSGEIIKKNKKELMFALLSVVMIYEFAHILVYFAEDAASIFIFLAAFLVALLGNKLYLTKFGVKDVRLELMMNNAAASSIRINFSLLFGATSILIVIYLFDRDEQLLPWIAIFAIYFIFLSSVKSIQTDYNRKVIS